MNRRRVTGAIFAVALAGAGAVGLVSWANNTKSTAEAAEAETTVVIVDKLVPTGADADTIKAATHVGTVQQKALQPGALTSEGQIGSQVAATDLQPGDQLVAARLAKAERSDHADKVTISATLSAERAVGGTIEAGDLVGVYLSFESFDTDKPESDTTTPAKTPNTTHLEFQKVPVTNVQTTSDPVSSETEDGPAQVSASNYIVTLALTPAQSERFVFAKSSAAYGWRTNRPQSATTALASSRSATFTRW